MYGNLFSQAIDSSKTIHKVLVELNSRKLFLCKISENSNRKLVNLSMFIIFHEYNLTRLFQ